MRIERTPLRQSVKSIRPTLPLVLLALLGCSYGAETRRAAQASEASPAAAVAQRLSPEGEATLRALVGDGKLPELRWPDFADYRAEVGDFYQAAGYSLAWIRESRPSEQARELIGVLQSAATKGLRAEDYDGPQWEERLQSAGLSRAGSKSVASENDFVRFDLALTVCIMRYITHLHGGRVNPHELHFGLDLSLEHNRNQYDISEFLRERLVSSSDVIAALDQVQPPFPAYRRTLSALDTYRKLVSDAAYDSGAPLPIPAKAVKPGNPYPGVSHLARLLQTLGDLPGGVPEGDETIYQGTLVQAVKRFQRRHGLEPDGQLGRQTWNALNTPLSRRVTQLELALERWRWLPHEFERPPIVVNIPEFGLHAYNDRLDWDLSMKVVVGKAYRHKTPVFASYMKYVIFRPPWNVPRSIQRQELVPEAMKNPKYFLEKDFEIVDTHGNVASEGEIDPEILKQLRSGKLALRQRPGPKNSLGLIKFVFPNDHDVYMHDTPATVLFSKARRDFSHGCIRVEDPVALAEWVLRDQPEWTSEQIRAAMNGGQTVRVSLVTPIPVLILYSTAVVMEDGEIRFFEDIYGHDAALERALAAPHITAAASAVLQRP